MKIVADDKIPFLKGVLEAKAEVCYSSGKQIDASMVKDADALIVRTRTRCDAALLSGSSVSFVATATIGHDHIDKSYCDSAGIRWQNAPGCNSSSVQQYFVAALLKLAVQKNLKPEEMYLGVIGVGHVGSKVAAAARALGMKVLLNDPPRARAEGGDGFIGLETLLSESDMITLHVPLTWDGEDRTFHMVDDDFFNSLGKPVILFNTSRGEVIDSLSLKAALSKGLVSSLVLDVWENEPDIDQELLAMADIATPHIAGYSTDGKANGTSMSVQGLSRVFGLDLDNWYPAEVPGPEQRMIVVDGTGMGRLQLLEEVFTTCYDIMLDDSALKASSGDFEKLRGDYRIRREPSYYQVRIINDESACGKVLEKLGFSVLVDHCM